MSEHATIPSEPTPTIREQCQRVSASLEEAHRVLDDMIGVHVEDSTNIKAETIGTLDHVQELLKDIERSCVSLHNRLARANARI